MSEISRQALIDVYAEARLLDEQRYEQWLDLFTEDGYYWMPLVHDQQDARLHASLMHEDKLLLRIRVERLAGRRTFSQQPKSRSHHLLQQPTVESMDEEKRRIHRALRLPLHGNAWRQPRYLCGLEYLHPGAPGRRFEDPSETGGSAQLRRAFRQYPVVYVIGQENFLMANTTVYQAFETPPRNGATSPLYVPCLRPPRSTVLKRAS